MTELKKQGKKNMKFKKQNFKNNNFYLGECEIKNSKKET